MDRNHSILQMLTLHFLKKCGGSGRSSSVLSESCHQPVPEPESTWEALIALVLLFVCDGKGGGRLNSLFVEATASSASNFTIERFARLLSSPFITSLLKILSPMSTLCTMAVEGEQYEVCRPASPELLGNGTFTSERLLQVILIGLSCTPEMKPCFQLMPLDSMFPAVLALLWELLRSANIAIVSALNVRRW